MQSLFFFIYFFNRTPVLKVFKKKPYNTLEDYFDFFFLDFLNIFF